MTRFHPCGSAEDRLAIRDLAEGYAWAIDHHDAEAFSNLFTADGRLVTYHGNDPTETPRNAHTGPAALQRIVTTLALMYPRTLHLVCNHWSAVDGDTAQAFTACSAHHLTPDPYGHGATDYVMLIQYHDDVVRQPSGAWKIQERRMLLAWSGVQPVVGDEVRGGTGLAGWQAFHP